mmetsp:Transcript_21764/g.35943  ORF Transcript_21764/g.35943 Transcript_21764/m.35943 type:complete len:243 (-) Transcript_21764:28-756(-)
MQAARLPVAAAECFAYAIAGRKKASVLPEPVSATPIMSRPPLMMGQHSLWIGVGRAKSEHALRTSGAKPASANVATGVNLAALSPVSAMLYFVRKASASAVDIMHTDAASVSEPFCDFIRFDVFAPFACSSKCVVELFVAGLLVTRCLRLLSVPASAFCVLRADDDDFRLMMLSLLRSKNGSSSFFMSNFLALASVFPEATSAATIFFRSFLNGCGPSRRVRLSSAWQVALSVCVLFLPIWM